MSARDTKITDSHKRENLWVSLKNKNNIVKPALENLKGST